MILHNGDHNGANRTTKGVGQGCQRFFKVGVFRIHFGDKEELGGFLFVGGFECLFIPYGAAGFPRQNYHGGACGAQTFAHSAGKVEQTRGVNDVQFQTAPFHRRHGGGKRYVAFAFFGVKVHNGVAVGNSAQTVGAAAKIKHSFGQRGFTLAAVTGQCDIFNLGGNILFQFKYTLSVYSREIQQGTAIT